MKTLIIVMLLLMSLIHGFTAEDSLSRVVVLANSIDKELNGDFIQNLRETREVIVVGPAEFQAYRYAAYIIILGGVKAPDTGTITESIFPSRETGTSQSMVVTLNAWKNDQVVIVLAGSDREGTREACENHFQHVLSLLDAVQVVSTIVESSPSLVFLWPSPLRPSDQIAPFAPLALPLKVTELPYLIPHSLNEETWFFWVDDCPAAKFAHPTRFIFYSIATGACNVYSERWWPVLNGIPLWVDSSSYWDTSYWVHNPGIEQPHASPAGSVSSDVGHSDVKDRALLINGWGSGQPLGSDMAEDERGMQEALVSVGFTTESASTSSEIKQVLVAWSRIMRPDETLLIYITAHGDKGMFLVQKEVFTITDLVAFLTPFDSGVHIHIILDTCHAGYSLSTLKSEAELVIAAAGEKDAAYGDCDPADDMNPSDSGSEFTSGLVITIKELARTESRISQWKVQAASRDFSWYILLLMESFKVAQELDVNAHSGITTPLIWTAVTDLEPPTQSSQEGGGCGCGG
ncbi:MAG: hypothetical protein HXS41_00860 [Theionarchaea archaeon]|nr:hypothetical protein [Theionarchaea archaeon]MBU6999298.1 hypothetical protein [Theionarchaea archaeon]MBU7019577.1 hypothetical protein [Theionarchaea archaeon]MBU7033756.1 hypothetical protein [Theionarchaea archaeon]MBU7039434.1 hypothetical protein [Theionarchaea archaeon]